MKQRLLPILLFMGCAALGVLSCMLYLKQDRTPPVITLSEEKLSYQEGQSYDKLLIGVSAKDNKDGDVTDKVFVDKIVPVEGKQAVVYYGVVDQSKNVGTATRVVAYKEKKTKKVIQETTESETTSVQETTSTQETTSVQETTLLETNVSGHITPTEETPVIELKSDQQTITAGSPFNKMDVVSEVSDTKDDRSTLYTRISVDGVYDIYTTRNYQLKYYVTDTDGNVSEVKDFTLTVE